MQFIYFGVLYMPTSIIEKIKLRQLTFCVIFLYVVEICHPCVIEA